MVNLYNKYCIVARFGKCLSSCRGEQSEGDHQVEAFQNHTCVARVWVRCVTSAWKGHVWFLLTSRSGELYFTLIWHGLPLQPVWIFPLLCSISSFCHFCSEITFGGTAFWWEDCCLQIYIFIECYSKLVVTTRTL